MDFIHTYFSMKIGAVKHLLRLTKDAWDNQVWLAVVLMVLWTLFCTIGGILLTPIDVIVCGISWYAIPGVRDVFKDMTEALNDT